MLKELPSEIIIEISNHTKVYSDLISLKLVNTQFYKLIKNFGIIKLALSHAFKEIKKKQLCANANCYNETFDVSIDNYRTYGDRYIHCHQDAMNFDNIILNRKRFKVFSPYCHDCFKNHVLLVGVKTENIKDLSCEGFVDVEFLI